MAPTFPKFKAHNEAHCFNCGGDFGDGYWDKSGLPPGRGEWKQVCSKCGMDTFYDLTEAKIPVEKFAANKPRKGQVIHFTGIPVGVVTLVEGPYCWYETRELGRNNVFVWCFRDGLNKLHDWPTKATSPIAGAIEDIRSDLREIMGAA